MTMVYCEHNYLLVALSYLVSVLGSYTGLQLAIGIPTARTQAERWRALFGAGAALGGGAIWAMHFIAMLACQMTLPVTYAPALTLLSAVVAIAACTLGLFIAAAGVLTWTRLVPAGICMGLGVAAMHYIGMAAMLIPAAVVYDATLVAASVVIAIIASIAALWLALNLRGWAQMLLSALVMGVAVCGMHYTGMKAVSFQPYEKTSAELTRGLHGESLGLAIFVLASLLLAIVLVVTALRRQRRTQLQI